MPGSVRLLREVAGLRDWIEGNALIVRALHGPGLIVFDSQYRPRLELIPCLEQGYQSRRGVEWPAGGVQVRVVSE
jgi:hypothetical protein